MKKMIILFSKKQEVNEFLNTLEYPLIQWYAEFRLYVLSAYYDALHVGGAL